jgi:hypothetical protein
MSAIMNRSANEQDLKAALARVDAVDLERIRAKVQKKLGWGPERAARAVEQYRQYLALLVIDPDQILAPPSEDADEIWHAHILDTQAYHHDCEALFGTYLHHVPSYGTPQEKVQMATCKERTELVFESHFGRPAAVAEAALCFGTPGLQETAAGCVPCFARPTDHQAQEQDAFCVCVHAGARKETAATAVA